MEKKFKSKTYGYCNVQEAIKLMIEKIKLNPHSEWVLAVGTDSQNRDKYTKFCQVIMLYQVGKGGQFFYRVHRESKISILQHRMLEEARDSIMLAKEIIESLDNAYIEDDFDWTDSNIKLEIHCDLGPNGKSSESIKETMGWIMNEFGGMVTPQIKPMSSAASCIADIYTK